VVRETLEQAARRLARRCSTERSAEVISEANDILRNRFDRGWLDRCAQIPIRLVVDDVGFMPKPSDWALEAVYCLANDRRASGLKTIWTTNLTPDQIRDAYGQAIASRLLGGEVIEIDGRDRRLGAA
jgi:hypothetical protein